MHWAMRSKKEPMLEASKAEIPVTSQADDHHAKQEGPKISSHDAMPSSSKQISKCFLTLTESMEAQRYIVSVLKNKQFINKV